MTDKQIKKEKLLAAEKMNEAGLILRQDEAENIEIADFGLNDFDKYGLSLYTYINTQRVCAKELIMKPNQICPEHYHPDIEGIPGKEETFRCRKGKVYLYVPGEETPEPKCTPPDEKMKHFLSKHEISLDAGSQYTLMSNTPHWFAAGEDGAIVSEFSTRSADEKDIFTDPEIQR